MTLFAMKCGVGAGLSTSIISICSYSHILKLAMAPFHQITEENCKKLIVSQLANENQSVLMKVSWCMALRNHYKDTSSVTSWMPSNN